MVLVQEYAKDLGEGKYSLSQKYMMRRAELVTSAEFVPSPTDINTGSLEDLYFPVQQTVEQYEGEPAWLPGHGERLVPVESAGQGDGEGVDTVEDYEDQDYIFLWPWVKHLESETTGTVAERQSPLLANPLFMSALARIGVVLALVVAGTQLNNWLTTPYLRNHEMCGITTGGQVRRAERQGLLLNCCVTGGVLLGL